MAAIWPAPYLRGLEKHGDARDLVVKVEYNGTLKRFNARVTGSHFDHNLAALQSKIGSAFKFNSDVEFVLTYTDEDGDIVMLDDENDLRDAAINQKLSPLRINVQLKNSNTKAQRTKQQASNSRSPRSAALEDQLAQVKSAIDEALKFVPEKVPAILAKLSHDLRSRAASSAPSLAELLDRFATLMTPKGNVQTSSGPVYGSSCSCSGGLQASRNTKHENELMTGSASQPLDMQNSESSKALGLKSVLPEDTKAQVKQAPVYPSVADSLIFTSSGGKKSDRKGSTVSESKGRCDSQSKGKFSTSSALPPIPAAAYYTPAPFVVENKGSTVSESKGIRDSQSKGKSSTSSAVPPIPAAAYYTPAPSVVENKGNTVSESKGRCDSQSKGKSSTSSAVPPIPAAAYYTPAPSVVENKGNTVSECKGRCDSQSKGKSSTSSAVPPIPAAAYYTLAPSVVENKARYWPTYGSNGLVSGGLQSRRLPSTVLPPYIPHWGSSGNTNSDWLHTPPTNMFDPPELDMPSSLGYVRSKDSTYHFGSSCKYDVPSSVSDYPEDRFSFGHSYNYGSIPQGALHKWIQCDGCGVTPIVGPRYRSNVRVDYDLCGACFSHMGNDFEYTRLDKPAAVNNQKLPGRGELKLEATFIKDVTVPDGTPMAASTPFTKIWRMRNCGCTVWPFGTQVIWVGGDHFAVQSSVKLAISANGVGVAGGQEIDVGVDFLAPAKPGTYISYWRLASPSGKEFGQQIWVLIQVEPIQTNGNKKSAAANLNLPAAASSTASKPFIINLESEPEPNSPTAPKFYTPGSTSNEMFARFYEPILPKEPEPASSSLQTIPEPVKQVQIPATYHDASSAGPAMTSMAASMPGPETIPLPKYLSFAAPASALNVPAHASVPTAALLDGINNMEEKLLRELEELGFRQVDLNKEILRQNKYDLEQSVRDLCGICDWDPIVEELSELGFDDAGMNKEAVAEAGGGSIKRLVKNLMARVKDQ
ncbi:hypothetical protein EJB05_39116 [Eragrostis curvula]|uniref:ZZ-type domain-containing protein n=1 Tax=Eragrostis curvula TaxID=38414 RepID=A0A5J9TW43_9POAL|nr:hypothetical protein EJB05_39116 [Eragrostis curvula]